ncbi:MAG: sensor histidine kinase [Pseudomonadota bacterium]
MASLRISVFSQKPNAMKVRKITLTRAIAEMGWLMVTSIALLFFFSPTAHAFEPFTFEPIATPHLNPVALLANQDSPPVGLHVYYTKPFNGEMTPSNIASYEGQLQHLDQTTINFGPPFGRIMAVFSVENSDNAHGEWVLTTGRGALKKFKLVELTASGAELIVDGSDQKFVGEMLQTYHSFTHRFSLAPGQKKQFALTFQGRHSTFLPLQVLTIETFFKNRFANIALVTGSFIGMIVLIFISMQLYSSTGREAFLWVGVAEIFHAMHVLHIEGYTTFYVLYKSGDWIYPIGNIFPLGYSIAMAHFARRFIKTDENFPILNLFLRGLIWGGLFMLAVLIVFGFFETSNIDPWISLFSGLPSCFVLIILPYVSIVATLRLDRQYWPLIVAWGTLALFVFYATFAATGTVQWLPFNWHITGPMALFQTFFAVLAVTLHVRKIHDDSLNNAKALTQSMQKQLMVSNEAARLAEEKATALATVHDQGHLLHASGHDSRQVLMALNSVIDYSESSDSVELPDNLLNMLKSSSAYLNDIVSTTMSAPLASTDSGKLIVLSHFQIQELIRPLEMIYRPMIIKKGLAFSIDGNTELWLTSDRANLSRVISNLLSNALKFTSTGTISIHIEEKNAQIILSVHDTGQGMKEEMIERLRNPSQMRILSEDKNSGSGFGLRSSLKLITALKGEIDVASTIGEGTRISVRLPAITLDNPKYESGDEITILQAKEIMTQHYLFDADRSPKSKLSENTELRNFKKAQIIPVTYDDSSQMRNWANDISTLIFLKPMRIDYLHHPLLKE